jgi:hypothetical protein
MINPILSAHAPFGAMPPNSALLSDALRLQLRRANRAAKPGR